MYAAAKTGKNYIFDSHRDQERRERSYLLLNKPPFLATRPFDVRFRTDMKKVTGVIPGECQELVCVCVCMLVFVYVRQERGTQFRREEQMEMEREREWDGERERMKKRQKEIIKLAFLN